MPILSLPGYTASGGAEMFESFSLRVGPSPRVPAPWHLRKPPRSAQAALGLRSQQANE